MFKFFGAFFRKVRQFDPDHPRSVSELGLRKLLRKLDFATVEHLRLAILADARYQNSQCLSRHGFKAYSQHEEDGLLDEIFKRIGVTNNYFVEFGVGDGLENNTAYRLAKGWRGFWIEGASGSVAKIRGSYRDLLADGRLSLAEAFVSAENIERLLVDANVPEEFDLLSIDIDGNDYWVWNALTRCRPRVLVIEYNAGLVASAPWIMPYRAEFVWDGSRAFRASLKALELLGKSKGYALVGCDISGTNAFFVREDLLESRFQPPYNSETHFEPARYYLVPFPGHAPSHLETAAFTTGPAMLPLSNPKLHDNHVYQ